MTINDVPEVVIALEDSYKFIVALLIDGNGDERLVVRAEKGEGCGNHRDILGLLRQEVRSGGLNVHCIGGGRIDINSNAKTICIWGYSYDFGEEPDRKETVRMLQVAFPDFQVTSSSGW